MAISPINYTMNVADPANRVLQGAAEGQDFIWASEQRGIALDQNERAQAAEGRAQQLFPLQMQWAELGIQEAQLGLQAEQQRIAAAQQQLDRTNAFRQGWSDLVMKGTQAAVEDFDALNAQFPEMSAATMEYYDQLDERRQRPLVSTLAQAATALKSGNIEAGLKVAGDFVEAARAAGDPQLAAMAEGALKLAEVAPDAAYAQIGALLRQVAPDLAENVIGKPGGGTVGAQEILDDGTIIQSTPSGPKVFTAGGQLLTGKAAEDKIKEARAFEVGLQQAIYGGRRTGTLTADVEMGGAAAGAEALGKETIKQAVAAFESLGNIQQQIGTINTAIRAIDEGAKAGAIQKFFPNITQSSAELENAMNRMGLDVIGSVTFGALSEGEMRLAMETAVPRNLDEDALREWLVAKRDAQEKAGEALFNAARYLSTPGNTLNTWIQQQGSAANADPRGTNAQIEELAARFGITPEEANFVVEMQRLKSEGQQLGPEQVQRLQQINQKMVRQ